MFLLNYSYVPAHHSDVSMSCFTVRPRCIAQSSVWRHVGGAKVPAGVRRGVSICDGAHRSLSAGSQPGAGTHLLPFTLSAASALVAGSSCPLMSPGLFRSLVPQSVQQEVVWEPVQHGAVRPSSERGHGEAAAAPQVEPCRPRHTGRTQTLRGDDSVLRLMTSSLYFCFLISLFGLLCLCRWRRIWSGSCWRPTSSWCPHRVSLKTSAAAWGSSR